MSAGSPHGTVLVVGNRVDPEAGHVGERFEQLGFTLRRAWREDGGCPDVVPDGVDVLLLLGSDWSVHSPVDAAALAAEAGLVRDARARGVPVLGLCYGAQVIAHALGGAVAPAPEPEVGLVSVDSEDPALVPAGPWWEFHLDVLDPPPGARVVARNGCGVQAFTMPGMLGVQFHPEVLPETLDDWARRFPELLDRVGRGRDDLVAEAARHEAQSRLAAHALVDDFLARCADGL